MKTLQTLVTEISKKTLNSYLDKSKGPDYPDEKTFRKRMIGGATALRKLGKKIPGSRSQPKVKIKATNESLDEALNFDASFPDVWSALEHVNSIAEQYGVSLPEIEELDNDEFGEEVFQVEEDAYLYFCYALNEQGEYDIVSGVFNSSELDELLSEEE